MRTLEGFRHIYCVDFEFSAPPGERPRPICLVATEYRSGVTMRLWEDDLRQRRQVPYPTTSDCLFVGYYASAEIGCHLALDWPVPLSVLDLYGAFRNQTNGLWTPCGAGLVGALTYYGLDSMAAAEKDDMRQLAPSEVGRGQRRSVKRCSTTARATLRRSLGYWTLWHPRSTLNGSCFAVDI